MKSSTEKFTNVKFVERLDSLITASGYNRKEIARKVGISPASITNYLNKNRLPKADELVKLSRYFGVTTDFLLGWDDASENARKTMSMAGVLAEMGHSEEEKQAVFESLIIALLELDQNLKGARQNFDIIRLKCEQLGGRKFQKISYSGKSAALEIVESEQGKLSKEKC